MSNKKDQCELQVKNEQGLKGLKEDETAAFGNDCSSNDHPCPCCRKKATERSEQFQKDLQKRLSLAIGQLNGVKRMLDENCYCGDVLTQVAAAQGAVRTVALMVLKDHMETCVAEQIREGNDEVIDEIVQLIKKFSR